MMMMMIIITAVVAAAAAAVIIIVIVISKIIIIIIFNGYIQFKKTNPSGSLTRIDPRALFHHTRKEVFYLTTHSKHFTYGYMVLDIW